MIMNTKQLIRVLNECKATCEYCANACLDESNLAAMVSCIRLDTVCATVCGATASVLNVSYGNADPLVNYCIEICRECAEECEKHEHEHCQLCARNCRACMDACKSYLQGA
jgi:hypothetical protein